MLWKIARFELSYQVRQPLLWVMTLFFFLLNFAAASSDGVTIGGGIGNIHRNAPWVILQTLTIMSILGMFIITVFVAGAILRDFERGTQELMFSRPIKKRDYLLGRFVGACLISLTVFMGAFGGILVGSMMWWVDPQSLGPFMPSAYLYTLLVMVIPNLVLTSCVFFSLAGLSRSMRVTYLGVVGFFACWLVSSRMLGDFDSAFLGALLDPFGWSAVLEATKYWTIVEKNSMLPPLDGIVLYNRLLWLGIGTLILAAACFRFRMSVENTPGIKLFRWRRKKATTTESPTESPIPSSQTSTLPKVAPRFGFKTSIRQFLYQTQLEAVAVFKSVPFGIMLAIGLFNLLGGIGFFERQFGTAVYPVTRLMLEVLENSFTFFLIIIVILYAGELIWRERSAKLDGVFDSMPVPNWVYLGSKLVALQLVVMVFLTAGMLATMGYQLWHGYSNFELPLYGQGFVVLALPFLLISFLASFSQVASGGKFLGYLLMILYIISSDVLDALDFGHNLYRFADSPNTPYSDMNGYGHFLKPFFWFNLYWALAAAVMTCLMSLFWIRGTDTAWRKRLVIAGQRFKGSMRLALPLALLAFIATGSYIFYNTNVLNQYIPTDKGEALQADYEKKFRQYRDIDLPRIADVYVDVDIYPLERRVEARGRYLLVNRNEKPLKEFHLSIPRRVVVNELDFAEHRVKLQDKDHGYTIYELARPMAPGEEMELRFDVTVENPGFVNSGSDVSIVHNGTFFNNTDYFPTFGYSDARELQNRNDRRKHDLPPVHRFAKVDDVFARRNTFLASDSDWINFETVVSTHADQIAIAPGYLEREWTEGERRYFHYKMDTPILHFYSYLSADYQVHRDEYGEVAIEIYYQEGHEYNLDRITDSIKKSLAYFSKNFGPYQHRQMRIIEFPRYRSFAQSFPNTVPFSEGIGFIAKLDENEEEDIDFPFYVTAHEVAHQWWGHQVTGGYVQGATLLAETMSQYSALMVMEEEYGPEKMRRFLKFELDNYLRGRSRELVEEMPLMLVENQPYIHYRKGSVVMYALRDALGEEVLNDAIKRYAEAVRFQKPPFTNSVEFLDFIREVTPPEKENLITDLFEYITLFENRVETATYAVRNDGKYVVTLVAKARKIRSDGEGIETEVPLDDWVDVGVFGEKKIDGKKQETVLFLEKRHLTESESTFQLVVDELPIRAGIDPYNKLVDRNSGDNVKKIKEGSLEELGAGAAGS
jgi:ABC-type transport system involved in multi-copper enzyme maturation permease subunit